MKQNIIQNKELKAEAAKSRFPKSPERFHRSITFVCMDFEKKVCFAQSQSEIYFLMKFL